MSEPPPDPPLGENTPESPVPEGQGELISITEDKMRAVIPLWGLPEPPTWESVQQAAQKLMIAIDLDRKAFDEALAKKSPEVVIAQGDAPVTGIQQAFEILPKIRKALEAGFVCVGVGDELGSKIPAEEGKPGLDVFNDLIPPPEPVPREGAVIFGAGTSPDDTGGKIRSRIKGVIRLSEDLFEVCDTLEIPGDLDLSVGHIDINCSMNVKGTIRSGFRIRSEGSVTVGEHIDDSVLIVDGDVTAAGGIFHRGHGSVESLGTITCNHAENARLSAGKDIVITAEAMHCKLSALGTITAIEKKGTIIGGQISAGTKVEARVLGSEADTPTRICVGFSHTHVPGLLALIKESEGLLAEVEVLLDPKKQPFMVLQMTPKGREFCEKLAGLRRDLAQVLLTNQESVARWLKDYSPSGEVPHVNVLLNVFRKVEIQIDKLKYAVHKNIAGALFSPNEEGSEIEVGRPQ